MQVPAVQVVQKTVEDSQAQFTKLVLDIPAVQRRQIPFDVLSAVQHHRAMVQKVQMTHEALQLQFIDEMVRIPVVVQKQMLLFCANPENH